MHPPALYLGGSRLGWNLVGILAWLLGLAVVSAWILSSYFKVDVATMVSYPGADGWCNVPHEGIGVHCFGDFGAITFNSLTSPPVGPELVYPLSSRILRIPFFVIASLSGFQASLIAFLIVSAACVTFPVVWAVRDVPWALKPVVVTVLGVTTTPFLMVLDRGNMLAFAVPALFLALLGLVRDKPWLVAISTIVAASVKPQFALIAVVLLALHRWRAAAMAILGSAAILVLPYLMYGNAWLAKFVAWLDAAHSWSRGQPLAVNWPGNISFPRVLYLLAHAGPWRDSTLVSSQVDGSYTTVSIGLLAIVVVLLVLAGRRLPPLALGVSALAVACLASPLTYIYYLVFLIPVGAIVFRQGLGDWPAQTRWDQVMPVLLAVALVLGLSPLPIPLGGNLAPPVASLLPVLSTCAWALFLGAMALWSLMRLRARPVSTSRIASTEGQ